MSMAINLVRGWPIIFPLLISFFYLLYSNIISLTSLKITLALLFITKIKFCFYLEKSGPKTGPAGLVPTPLMCRQAAWFSGDYYIATLPGKIIPSVSSDGMVPSHSIILTMESVDVTISTTSSVEITATTSSSSFALFIIIIITSTSDLQPSTAIANQLPGQ